ncbi:LVIVD repeat-containing protein [Haloarcula sp. GH36]|uniref:LVIVD repeat-containing protein n=1 Tax=Haloarcula montana TaxID=3111776 RepID=UPI002D77A940|nr:twin-arginine translocation signal domain-containing protein [Haloarcula sp. GH36]
MNRRAFLRTVGVTGAAVGASLGSQTGTGHPLPEGNDRTPISETPSGDDPIGFLALSAAYETVTSPDGHTAYVATGDGVAVVDLVTPTRPRLLTRISDLLGDTEPGPINRIQDLAVSGSRLLVAGPAHPADGAHGLVVFDVSDRQAPTQVGAAQVETTIHNCDFDGRHAYLTGGGRDGNPLLVVDTRTGREVGTWRLTDADERWADVPATLRPLHDVWVQGDRAYLAYWDAGTWVLDVSDPTAPERLARVRGRSPDELTAVEDPGTERSEPPGNDHFVTVDETAGLLGVGAESWDLDGDDSGGPSGLALYDIDDLSAPTHLATIEPPPTTDPTPGGVLTTAHNFELVDGRCYSAWYNGGVRVHDISDPSEPREIAAWRDGDDTAFWTAQRASDCFVATSTNAVGGADVQPGLYTFPDPASVETPTATATPTDGSGERSASGAAGDGFGVLGTLSALGLSAWYARRRDDRSR